MKPVAKIEKKYRDEGKRLCDLQHKNIWKFMMFFDEVLPRMRTILMFSLFKEMIKVKHVTLTPVKIMSCMNLLLSSYIAFTHIFISPWDFKLYVMMKL